MKKMDNKGFSLVELIIVIAIMAILVGVLAPQFIKYVESSRESTDLQNIAEVKTAIEAFAADNELTPSTEIKVEVDHSAKTITVSRNNDYEHNYYHGHGYERYHYRVDHGFLDKSLRLGVSLKLSSHSVHGYIK